MMDIICSVDNTSIRGASKAIEIESVNNPFCEDVIISLNYKHALKVRDFINENLEKIKPSEEKRGYMCRDSSPASVTYKLSEEKYMTDLDFSLCDRGDLQVEDTRGVRLYLSVDDIKALQAWLQENPEFLNPKPKYDFPPDFKPGTILKHTENYGWAFHDAKNLVTSLVYMKLLIDVPEVPEGTPLDTIFVKD